jgi:hypothetical protein
LLVVLRTTKTTVAKWRGQFVERRLEGLYDEPRVGAPRTISDEQVEAIIVTTLETIPPGAYVDVHNDRDTPFKWVRRFGLRIQQLHGQ